MVSTVFEKHYYPTQKFKLASFLINFYFDSWILLALVAFNPKMLHWFIIPTFCCGMLIGADAIKWLQGDYDLFDPKGILGIIGWHFFFMAPLLFIFWDVGMRYVVNPPDWRPWVGYLSCLNVIAIIFYHRFHDFAYKLSPGSTKVFWGVRGNKAFPWYVTILVLAVTAQVYYLTKLGGISGIINLTSIRKQTGFSDISGVGLLEMLGGTIPIVFIIMLSLVKTPRSLRWSTKITTLLLIILLAIMQFTIGGFRGSRSSTIWSLFWIAGVIHYYWRPFSRRIAIFALLLLLSFLYFYGFYKGNSKVNGLDAFLMLIDGSTVTEIETRTGRTFEEMMVADLARVDTQSYQLYRLSISTDYEFRWGKTYLSSFSSFIPGWIWPDRPLEPEKIIAGTELFYGEGAYIPGSKYQNSQKVYGLGGEALLNFGYFAFPFPFIIWGYLMGRFRRSMASWNIGDFRWYFAPFITLLFVIALIGDFYNLLGFFVSKGFIPIMILIFTLLIFRNKQEIETYNAIQT